MNSNKRKHRKRAKRLHQSIMDQLNYRDGLSRDKGTYISFINKHYDMTSLRPFHIESIIDESSSKELYYLIEEYPSLSGLIEKQYDKIKRINR